MRKFLISFSGGRTSAYMTRFILAEMDTTPYGEVAVVFANTGQEDPRTLEFVHQCDVQMGFNTVWVEAEVIEGRASSRARVVSYETASRDGRPYEDVVRKYGIANADFPHCTRELKLRPIHDFIRRGLGWKDYDTALGIRADEKRRVSARATRDSIVYPLVDWMPTTKEQVNDWWAAQAFDLQVPEHLGNCTWCWKKSDPKLARVFHEAPEVFDFPARLEVEYRHAGYRGAQDPRVFFRQHRSTEDIRAMGRLMNPAHLARMPQRPDENSGCGESCELYETVVTNGQQT